MKLSGDQVKKVAKLANLQISDKEEELYASQISAILDYIDLLNEVNTSKVEPTYNVSDKIWVKRDDIEEKGLSQTEALANASNTKGGYFVTKGVFEEE